VSTFTTHNFFYGWYSAAPFATLRAMQITVTIPDELAAQAQARGLALDRYLPELLAEDLATEAESRPAHPVSEAIDNLRVLREQNAERRNAAVDAMMQFAAKHGFTTGGRDLKSMVHEGHKY